MICTPKKLRSSIKLKRTPGYLMFKIIYKQIRLSKGRQVLKRTYSMISFTESSRADQTKSTVLKDKMMVHRGVVI